MRAAAIDKSSSRSYQWGGRKFLFYCFNSSAPRLSFVCSLRIWMRIQTEYRISKGNLLIGFVEGLCSHFSSLKEKMKNTLGEQQLHLEFLPFLAATDISKGLTRTRQLYVCFKGLNMYFFALKVKPCCCFPNNQLVQKSFRVSNRDTLIKYRGRNDCSLGDPYNPQRRSVPENCIVAVFSKT